MDQIPIRIFYSYAYTDKNYQDKIKKHLSSLRRKGIIAEFNCKDILAGDEWEREINKHLKSADIFLLLVSPDFLDSEYCYTKEMEFAIQRYDAGEVRIIPVIIRPCLWKSLPQLGRFQALPSRGKAVTSWKPQDNAYYDIAMNIEKVVERVKRKKGKGAVKFETEHHVDFSIPKSYISKKKTFPNIDRAGEKVGIVLTDIHHIIRDNFSLKDLKKRTRRFLSQVLLLIFTIMNVFVIPYLIYKWTNIMVWFSTLIN